MNQTIHMLQQFVLFLLINELRVQLFVFIMRIQVGILLSKNEKCVLKVFLEIPLKVRHRPQTICFPFECIVGN